MSGAAKRLTLYVHNLPWTVSSKELGGYFAQFGKVTRSKVVFDMKTGLSRGYGYVAFSNPSHVDEVLNQQMHHLEGNVIEMHTYNRNQD